MDILTTIPARLKGPDAIAPLLENVRQRIVLRAHENFVERGAVYGQDLDDWLDDQREEGKDVFVEVILPKIELTNHGVSERLRATGSCVVTKHSQGSNYTLTSRSLWLGER